MSYKTITKLLGIVAITFFVLAIIESLKSNEHKRNLEEAYSELQLLKDSLETVNEDLINLKRNSDEYIDSLAREITIDSLHTYVGSKNLTNRAKNSKYLLTFYTLDPSIPAKNIIEREIRNNGFTMASGSILNNRTEWLSEDSSILYYSNESKEKAEEIAQIIRQNTNLNFKVARGNGLGVKSNMAEWTFFIHYIGSEVEAHTLD